MLKSLYIKNYALIDELTVNFQRGLNIMTGETGAGKSIIIGALNLVLGERAETQAIRKGADKSIVEVLIDVTRNSSVKKILQVNDVEHTAELILRREVSTKGQSRAFINDTPVTTALLKEVGNLLVDLHGQHEHQSLLRVETHIDMLDEYGGLEALVREFGGAYRAALEILAAIRELKGREAQLMDRRALYEFQIKEIDAIGPRVGEEEDLERDLLVLENAERLFSSTEKLFQMLYEGDNALHDQLVLARKELEDLSRIDRSFEEPAGEAASAAAIVDELAKSIQRYNAKIEFNPERLEWIRNRLGHLTILKKKYGGSLEALIRHRESIGREFELAENFSAEIAQLGKQLQVQRNLASEVAQRLSEKRRDVTRKLNKAVMQTLKELGIPHAVFETVIRQQPASNADEAIVRFGKEWLESTARGADTVEFFISTNVGEDPKPLASVASGGEISRIMLALKMNLAKVDTLPLLVFDEIDVGVSGRIAQAVGRSLKKLSEFHQVISITHLPQIAGLADAHFVVEKVETHERTVTRMRHLDIDERVSEVAKLMSGATVTETGLETARELMGLKTP